jgi:hypothetical protein
MGYLNIKTYNTFEILLNDICGGQCMGPRFNIYHFLLNLSNLWYLQCILLELPEMCEHLVHMF